MSSAAGISFNDHGEGFTLRRLLLTARLKSFHVTCGQHHTEHRESPFVLQHMLTVNTSLLSNLSRVFVAVCYK